MPSGDRPLILSLFPGLGLMDLAFEQEGFTVVRGPDRLWGGDIRGFHPPAGRFDGVMGGPPCQKFSGFANLARTRGVEFPDLIPEFCRVVAEAQPSWWLMENVRPAPRPEVEGYVVRSVVLNNRWLGEEQNRERRFSFGTRDGRSLSLEVAPLEALTWKAAVTSANGGARGTKGHQEGDKRYAIVRYAVPEACRLQGLPEDFLDEAPFTQQGKLKALAEGVPLPMGRAIARAVTRALSTSAVSYPPPPCGQE
jgi:DNA (cytosine-5)-methyltransferase 1